MPSTVPIAHLLSDVWFDRLKVEEEEYKYEVYAANQRVKPTAATTNKRSGGGGGVAEKIAEARQKIHQTLQESDSGLAVEDSAKLNKLQSENAELRKIVNTLVLRMNVMESRLSKLESESGPTPSKDPAPEQKPAESDDDDSDDLFGSDEEEDIEADRIRKERLAAYMEKKSKKTAVIAKSTIVLEVKPWDDETDMAELEKCVRSVTADGLIWGASKLEKVAYGIMKLQITCVVEDDKVGTDFLEERITEFDEYIQSVDIVAFNKI